MVELNVNIAGCGKKRRGWPDSAIHNCVFPGCEYSCARASNLKRHARDVHEGYKGFKCDFSGCGQSFSSSSYVKRHVHVVHNGAKEFACMFPSCGQSFSTSSFVKRHVHAVHNGAKEFACMFSGCGQSFSQLAHLKRHGRAVHDGIKSFTCLFAECGKSFSRAQNLKRHEISVHEGYKNHTCQECAKAFSDVSILKKHLKRHEESKTWKFACKYVDGGLAVTSDDDGMKCTIKCKTEIGLAYHTQAAHTTEGMTKKMQSEQKLADFLRTKDCAYSRDRENFVSHICAPELQLNGLRSYPDFFMPEISAALGAKVIVGNDEMLHRTYPCDLRRMLDLNTSLAASDKDADDQVPVLYIRFNPHFYYKDSCLYDRPLATLHEELWKILTTITSSALQPGLNLIYVNYNQLTPPADEPDELWRRLDLFVKLEADREDPNWLNGRIARGCVIGVH